SLHVLHAVVLHNSLLAVPSVLDPLRDPVASFFDARPSICNASSNRFSCTSCCSLNSFSYASCGCPYNTSHQIGQAADRVAHCRGDKPDTLQKISHNP